MRTHALKQIPDCWHETYTSNNNPGFLTWNMYLNQVLISELTHALKQTRDFWPLWKATQTLQPQWGNVQRCVTATPRPLTYLHTEKKGPKELVGVTPGFWSELYTSSNPDFWTHSWVLKWNVYFNKLRIADLMRIPQPTRDFWPEKCTSRNSWFLTWKVYSNY